ncbi:hypothetical protein MKK70_22145 [Methylobacterium sp. E-041]|uniref:hypothetical protein n=1 Tax=Methylobacterium sp. E-041 TaxID=2836573 RepID=UPI001FBB1D80|nr:hypothetical protein [Methylobacterium sp. E-041]MCJ2108025.1 hypothetical protein [Methylobacterium sp. E-041]
MSTIPSGALAGAAVSAGALAGVIADLSAGLPLAASVALGVSGTCTRIVRVSAPRVLSAADVAAIGVDLVGAVQAAARGAQAGDASAGLYAAAARTQACIPVSASPVLTRAYRFAGALAASVEAACLGEAFLAEARTGFADRRAATEARARISAAYDASADRIAATLGQDILTVLAAVARETSGHLVRLATTLQPVVRVDANRSFPSTALAWSLYGDPTRAPELLARNRCGTPLFMPATIEAVAPKA